jgi:uncharacterized lipoprotein YddW (UPF0748 family)
MTLLISVKLSIFTSLSQFLLICGCSIWLMRLIFIITLERQLVSCYSPSLQEVRGVWIAVWHSNAKFNVKG